MIVNNDWLKISLLVLFCVFGSTYAQPYTCQSPLGSSVNWWFMYQLPAANLTGNTTTFLYYDSLMSRNKSTEFRVNSTYNPFDLLIGKQLRALSASDTFLAYTNRAPGTKAPSKTLPQSRGYVGFGKDEGFWIVHNYPQTDASSWMSSIQSGERQKAYNAMCVTIDDLEAVRLFTNGVSPAFKEEKNFNKKDRVVFEDGIAFSISKEWPIFGFMKNKRTGSDIWSHLRDSGVDLLVKSDYLKNENPLPSEFGIANILGLNFRDKVWTPEYDESNWAISKDGSSGLVCFGDPRDDSQLKLNSFVMCLKDLKLNSLLKGMVTFVDNTFDRDAITTLDGRPIEISGKSDILRRFIQPLPTDASRWTLDWMKKNFQPQNPTQSLIDQSKIETDRAALAVEDVNLIQKALGRFPQDKKTRTQVDLGQYRTRLSSYTGKRVDETANAAKTLHRGTVELVRDLTSLKLQLYQTYRSYSSERCQSSPGATFMVDDTPKLNVTNGTAINQTNSNSTTPANVRTISARVFNVGQGNCISITLDDGTTIINDCGSTNDLLAPGFVELSQKLNSIITKSNLQNKKEIDYVFISHPDRDSTNLFSKLFNSTTHQINHLYLGNRYSALHKDLYEGVLGNLSVGTTEDFKGAQLNASLRIYTSTGGAKVNLLAVNTPPNALLPYESNNTGTGSIIFEIVWGNASLVLTGDATYSAEEVAIRRLSNSTLRVLQLGNHGADTGSKNWTSKGCPKFVFASAGCGYQHDPHKASIEGEWTTKCLVQGDSHNITIEGESKPTNAGIFTTHHGDIVITMTYDGKYSFIKVDQIAVQSCQESLFEKICAINPSNIILEKGVLDLPSGDYFFFSLPDPDNPS